MALEFFDLADDLIDSLPRGRGHLANQLSRAALSIVNNIAEGAGKLSAADKRRYYLTALGSSAECAAMVDICLRRQLIQQPKHRYAKELLDRTAAMLTKLAKSMQQR